MRLATKHMAWISCLSRLAAYFIAWLRAFCAAPIPDGLNYLRLLHALQYALFIMPPVVLWRRLLMRNQGIPGRFAQWR